MTYLTDAAGATLAAYRYDPYGRWLSGTGTLASANAMRFSSKLWMGYKGSNTDGLYYYGYRFYDPSTMRWVNRDPIREAGGLNLYGFVFNAPINFVDLFGLDSTKISPEAAKIALDLLADELGIHIPDLNLAQGLRACPETPIWCDRV